MLLSTFVSLLILLSFTACASQPTVAPDTARDALVAAWVLAEPGEAKDAALAALIAYEATKVITTGTLDASVPE